MGSSLPRRAVHPDFADVARTFADLFTSPSDGGGALAVYRRGEPVLDVWAGWTDAGGTAWRRDTMTMCFSTTKGVAATVVHRLVDRGAIDVDAPVAAYWDAFDTPDKRRVTVRHLLSHRAGLHGIRSLVDDPEEMLDDERMIDLVVSQRPTPRPGTRAGYHGLSLGWLLDGLVRAVTGTAMGDLFRTEVAECLGVDGLYLGAPPEVRDRVARLFPRPSRLTAPSTIARLTGLLPNTRRLTEAVFVDGMEDLWFDDRILDASMPSVNGIFTARALAAMYGALANRGEAGGRRLLSPETVYEAGRVQDRGVDYVLGVPMRWRLGYHRAVTANLRQSRRAFGHAGFGGSAGWADPDTGIGFGVVMNRIATVQTPVGDPRVLRIGGAVLAAARAHAATRRP